MCGSKHGAGILPYDGDLVFVGEQRGGWTSFSGSSQEGENPFQTAAREFCEETAGLFDIEWVTRQLRGVEPLVCQTPSGRSFYLFCMYLPSCSSHSHKFSRLRQCSDNAEEREMHRVEWVKLSRLVRFRLRSSFRADFEAIRAHVQQRSRLRGGAALPPGTLCSSTLVAEEDHPVAERVGFLTRTGCDPR